MELPAGEFLRSDRVDGPQFSVTLERPYAIGKFEVTAGQFATFVDQTGHETSGCELYHNVGPEWDPQTD